MPNKYFRRKDKFLAVQWRESRYEEIRQMTRGRVYYDAIEENYKLYTARHEFILRDGDYITKHGVDYELWSEDVFDSLFEIVPGQEDDEGIPNKNEEESQ